MYKIVSISCVLILCFAPLLYSAEITPEAMLIEELNNTKRKSKRVDIIIKLADLRQRGKEYEQALARYEEALSYHLNKRKAYSVYLEMGNIMLEMSKYAISIEHYSKAVQIRPKEEDARIKLAKAFEKSELFEKARAQYKKILKKKKKSFRGNYGMALLCLKQGFNTQALDYFRRALTIKPIPDVYRNISKCAYNLKDIDLAIGMIEQIALNKRSYQDYINLGWLHEVKELDEEAEKFYSHAIKINPASIDAYTYLGLFYIKKNRIVPAEKLLQIASEKNFNAAVVHFFLSYVYYRQEKYKMANQEINLAEKLSQSEVLSMYCKKFKKMLEK